VSPDDGQVPPHILCGPALGGYVSAPEITARALPWADMSVPLRGVRGSKRGDKASPERAGHVSTGQRPVLERPVQERPVQERKSPVH
jgi:hypothetical protein